MRMSNRQRSGLCSFVSSTASSPFLASATISNSGQTSASRGAQLLAHQAFVVGKDGANGHEELRSQGADFMRWAQSSSV